MIDLDFLNELDRFNIVLKRRVNSRYSGERQSAAMGSGLVFADYKDYAPGDDFRNIDWKVYARTNKLFIRRYEEERNLEIHILVDSSASMKFGKKFGSKFEYAAQIGIGFAYMAAQNNEKFEFSTFADDFEPIKAKRGFDQLGSIIKKVQDVKPKGHSNFLRSMEAMKAYLRSRSLIVIVSDFLFDPEELKKSLYLFKKSEILVVQVLDPIELSMNLTGDFVFKDVESSFSLRAFITKRLKRNYRDRMATHIAELKSVCEGVGARFVSVTTDNPIFETCYALLN